MSAHQTVQTHLAYCLVITHHIENTVTGKHDEAVLSITAA
jgi:hypothetical protein